MDNPADLQKIQAHVFLVLPELAESVEAEITTVYCTPALIFRRVDRSCEVSYGHRKHMSAWLQWGDHSLCEFEVQDNTKLGLVIKHWLHPALAAEMRFQFPDLRISEAAESFEAGKEQEGKFILSWDMIEEFYELIGDDYAAEVEALMNAMHERGYHKTLRAGQSMSTLILSRSSEHGMRKKQATIEFYFFGARMRVLTEFKGKRKALTWLWQKAVLTPKLLAALDRLQDEPLT